MEKSFENNFLGDKKKLQQLSDGKLLTEDGYVFDIHRIALAEASEYFYKIFCERTDEVSDPILIPNVRGDVLDKLLCYIYTGNFDCTDDTVGDFLTVSYRLSFRQLQQKVKEYIKRNISTSNCLQILLASHRIKQNDIFRISFRFSQTHFQDAVGNRNSNIEELPVDLLKELLCNRNLCVTSEDVIWELIRKWTEYDKDRRQVHILDLLMCFKVADMDENLASTIIEHDIISRNDFCKGIHELRTSRQYENNLKLFCDLLEILPFSQTDFHGHRLPAKVLIYIKTKHYFRPYLVYKDIYISYDENMDIWRSYKHIEHPDFFHVVILRNYLFLFEYFFDLRFRILNMDNEEEIVPENEPLARSFYYVAKHEGLIYVLGGITDDDEARYSDQVEVYDPALNRWRDIAPMTPLDGISAASIGRKLYVTGVEPNSFRSDSSLGTRIAQVYDSETNSWTLLSPPNHLHCHHQLFTYQNKVHLLVVLRKCVQVYDAVSNVWSYSTDIPFAYDSPQAFVLDDQLFVHEHPRFRKRWSKPILRWIQDSECWEPVEDSSIFWNLPRYEVCIVDDFETLKALTKLNRKMSASFEPSPFN